MDLGPWTPNNANEYFLHVKPDGTEVSAEIERQSLLVTIVSVGDGFVDEVTRVFTFEREDRGCYFFDIVEPHGRGWVRDAAADAHTDKWSMWKRRRTWRIGN
jgi:hypothetical protein